MPFRHCKTNYRLIFGGILLSLVIVCFLVLATPETIHAIKIEPVSKILSTSDQIKKVWNQILTFVNSIAIVMLIFIAFANILRINISTYGIKKFLPSLALAIIAANFSYLFCRILVDFSSVICDLFLYGTTAEGISITKAFDFTKQQVTSIENYGRILLLAIMELIGAAAMLILAFMFIIRMYLIYFMVALSSLTIVCMVLPLTKTVFNMWWQTFWKWTFMPVVSLFWLWIGSLWANGVIDTESSKIFGFAFTLVCYYLAITTPSKMGQGIMTTWNNLGKWGWGKTGGAAWNATGGKSISNYKKLWGLKVSDWWEQQGIDGKIPIISGMAKRSVEMRERIKQAEDQLGRKKQKSAGAAFERRKDLEDRRNRASSIGGEDELIEAEQLAAYYKTPEGKAALDGRQMHLSRLASAQGDIKEKQTEVETAFIQGDGIWANGRAAIIRNNLLGSKRNVEMQENILSKRTDDEVGKGISEQRDGFNRNEDIKKLDRLQVLESMRTTGTLTNQKDIDEHTALTSEKAELERKVMAYLRVTDTDEFQRLATTAGALEKAKIQKLWDDDIITQGEDGKLVIPYYLQPTLKLSSDGREIEGLRQIDDEELGGSIYKSRLNRQLGQYIAGETQSDLGKFNIAQIGKYLTEGKSGDFDKDDIDKMGKGKQDLVDPVSRAKYLGMWRAFWTAQTSRPDSLQGQQFADALPGMLGQMDSTKQKELAQKTEENFKKELKNRNPNLTDAEIDTRMKTNKTRMEDYGNNPIKYISSVLTSIHNRNKALSVLSDDPIIGTSRPAADSFAGEEAGYRYSGSNQSETQTEGLDRTANNLLRDVTSATAGRFDNIAKKYKDASRQAGVTDSQLADKAFASVHQAKIATVDNFARSIGLLAKNGELSPVDREMMLSVMKKMKGKNQIEIQKNLEETFKGRYNLAQGQKITVPESEITPQSDRATKIFNAIEGVEKFASSDLVDSTTTYFSGIESSLSGDKNPAAKLQYMSDQSNKLVSNMPMDSTQSLPEEIIGPAREILSQTGRTQDHIENMLKDTEATRVALFNIANATQALSKSVNPETGQIDTDQAKEELFTMFMEQRKNQRMGDLIISEQNESSTKPDSSSIANDISNINK